MLVVTGATGFLGRPLVAALLERGDQVLAIARPLRPRGAPPGLRWIAANLLDSAAYESALSGASCVLHLAAATGKAPPAEYQRSNVDATRVLLQAAERAGVQHFVLVSSIAAAFSDRRYYPYAESKLEAERLVRSSRLRTTIVRPTMIFGPGSPIQLSLERLARLPVIPLFGDGQRRVQPVDVSDVVASLLALAAEPRATPAPIELGGPEVYTLRELLARLRALQGVPGQARFLPLPLYPLRWLLARLERALLPVLPFSAGQLASFANDSLANASEWSGPRPLTGLQPSAAAGGSA